MAVKPPLRHGSGPVKRKEFYWIGSVVFVTYCRSRVHDKDEFFRCLKDSLRRSLKKSESTRGITVEVYGSKEIHKDGAPHYHVVLRFSDIVHWNQAREKLYVWVDVGGRQEVDTHSLYIRKKPVRETDSHFLASVQKYTGKKGDVFGKLIVG